MNKYRCYFLALTLFPSLLSLLMLVGILKGNSIKVSNALYLITGLCNLTGFALLRKCDNEEVDRLQSIYKHSMYILESKLNERI